MLELKFVGDKPVITPSGVMFDSRKVDKYEWIEPAAHILRMFLYLDDTHDSHKLEPNEVYGTEKILDILLEAEPEFENMYKEAIKSHEESLDLEVEAVEKQGRLNDHEKNTLIKNYEFMKSYRVQRATNKIVYEEIINVCVKIIIDKKITDVKAPFSNTFLHVLGSLQSTLDLQKRGPRAEVEVKLDEENPYSQLSIRF